MEDTSSSPVRPIRFMTRKDLVITPLVQASTLVLAGIPAWLAHRQWGLGLLSTVALVYLALVPVTLMVLALLRWMFPVRAGIYSSSNDDGTRYIWNLISYLTLTNLHLLWTAYLVPPVPSLISPFCRKTFYWLLGAKLGRGIISIAGKLHDPYLITIERGAMIGDEAMLLPHAVTNGSNDLLLLGKIVVEEGAIIGARAILMPGVTVGRYATVNPLSWVPMNTKIPPYEVWGGYPARKIGEIRRAA